MIGILLITSEKIGNALLSAAKSTFTILPIPAIALEIKTEDSHDKEAILLHAKKIIQQLDTGDGVLILTDLFGSTASNLAFSLIDTPEHFIEVVSGVSLPMLIRTFNYPTLSLQHAAQKATSGGHDGIVSKTPVYESLL